MAEAQFTPYLPPGGIVDAAFSGANQMQSLMDRAQLMRQRQEMADRQKEVYEVGRPVMEAKANADLAIAQASLYNARQVQQLRSQFGEDSKAAGVEYQAAMQQPTYEKQANALSDVAQKYSYFELFPEGKAFMDTIQNKGLQQTHYGILDTQNRAALAREQQRFQDENSLAITKGEETRKTNAAFGKGLSKETNDYIYASSMDEDNPQLAEQIRQHAAASLANKTKTAEAIQLEQEIARMKADPNADPAAIGRLEMRAKTESQRAQKQSSFLLNEQAIKDAWARGDETTARRLEAKQIHDSGGDASAYPATPGPPEPPSLLQRAMTKVSHVFSSEPITPTAPPPPAPANTKTVKIEGKDYPVYTDAKGNRAYHKDGKYYPIP